MTEATEPVTVVLLILLFVLVYLRDLARSVRDRVTEWWSRRTALSPVEQLQEEYARGEIDEEELERRLTFALDERAETVRREIEAVDGVGPGRSA